MPREKNRPVYKSKQTSNPSSLPDGTEDAKHRPPVTRELTIFTWGSDRRSCPIESEKNFNVCQISRQKPIGVDLGEETGMCPEIQAHIEKQHRYPSFKKAVIDFVLENPHIKVISINCRKGRHRSVAFAQLIGLALAHEHNIIVNIKHLNIRN